MEGKFWYRLFVLVIFILLVGVGAFLGYRYTDKYEAISNSNSDNNRHSNKDTNTIEIYMDEDDIESVSTKSHDIEVVYVDYYSLCGEKITNSNIFYGVNLEEIKEKENQKQQNENKEYKIKEETNERLVYERMVDTYCPNHFKIILEKDKINIYSIVTKEKMELYKTLDIPVETLRIEVKNELVGGILVNSKEELNSIIEDIES